MDKSDHNQAKRKQCRTDSAPTVFQVERQEEKFDTRDNPVLVSGKGSIKFVVPEEKVPGNMLRKWKRRDNDGKVRK